MHADALSAKIWHLGIIETQAVEPVRRTKLLEHASSQHVHRMLLEPTVAVGMQHHDDFWSFWILQPCGKAVCDRSGGQVLRLNVNVTARVVQTVQKQAPPLR